MCLARPRRRLAGSLNCCRREEWLVQAMGTVANTVQDMFLRGASGGRGPLTGCLSLREPPESGALWQARQRSASSTAASSPRRSSACSLPGTRCTARA
eukprot:scaffold1934_cov444-Prasinococcus_capsulatus_cf.AAC.6